MIESKNLIPYLPYSLKVEMEGKKCNVAWMSTKNIAVHRPGGIGDYKKIAWKYASHNIKPILKPLSKLNDIKEDLIDANEFYDDAKISKDGKGIEFIGLGMLRDYYNIEQLPYNIMQVVLSNKYDVFGLIEQGLAVEEKIKEKAKQEQA